MLRIWLHKAEVRYHNDMFENNKNFTYNLWKHLGLIINPKKKRKTVSVTKLMVTGHITSNYQAISDGMNDFFCGVGPQLESSISNRGDQYKKYLPARLPHSFFLNPINANEILKEIKMLNTHKSPGHEAIGAKIIQICPKLFADNLCNIYNKSIRDEKISWGFKRCQGYCFIKKNELNTMQETTAL